MSNIVVRRVVYGSEAFEPVWQLREDVLRRPIGLSLRDEQLDAERNEYILAAYDAERLVGCVILQPCDTITVKLRQMAVSPDEQQKGVGRILVHEAEKFAWDKDFEQILLHARDTAVGFYEKLGYTVCSEEFTEVGIPHFAMEKHKK